MRKNRGRFFLVFLVLSMFVFHTPTVSYATDVTEEATEAETEEETEGDREAKSSVGKVWKDIINMAKDFFLGPAYDEREHIDDIKEIKPYDLLGDMSFPDDTGMKEAKEISASFYQLVCAVSVLGLILSFIGAGISIAINRARNKPDVEVAILVKIVVFAAICCVAGLWGLLVPLLKTAMETGS